MEDHWNIKGKTIENRRPNSFDVTGMDSLSAVEFRNRLSSELPNLDLPNTWLRLNNAEYFERFKGFRWSER